MSSSKTLTCPYITKQNINIESIFAGTVYNVAAVKKKYLTDTKLTVT